MQKVQNPYSPLQRQHARNMLEQRRRDKIARESGELRLPTEAELREKRVTCRASLRPVVRTDSVGSHPLAEKQRVVSDEGAARLEKMFEAERLRTLAEENAPVVRPSRATLTGADWAKVLQKRNLT